MFGLNNGSAKYRVAVVDTVATIHCVLYAYIYSSHSGTAYVIDAIRDAVVVTGV